MGEIKSVAILTKDGQANINRAAIKHRATWMGLIYDESGKAGVDSEPISRRAIRKCRNIHGKNLRAACPDPGDCRDLAKVLLNDLGRKASRQEVYQVTETEVPVGFHYCVLLNVWEKLGLDDETCAIPCGIAMDGDRGIVEAMGLSLELTDILAKGCSACKLCFHR